ncbi:superoxide dismutase family protein [Aerococcus tenax]|uniref:superoxide dismutase family protein n=1 Tax=Aerococcus tenax TaxID=3078812 RepID=UPI0018A7512E|nr:superoxide dismutase family protein [Aerococcus tenax]
MSDEKVVVNMLNQKGEDSGTATFEEGDGKVKVTVDFHGLPEGEFAMHIHEYGAASPEEEFADAKSHFNPTGVDHGKKSENGPHLGDLPNIEVPASGDFKGVYEIEGLSLKEDAKYSLHNDGNGTALIVHTGADDYISQPTGDAGGRQLGGVIFPAK